MRHLGGLLAGAGLVASSCLLPSVEVSDSLSGAGVAGAAAGTHEVFGGDGSGPRAGAAGAEATVSPGGAGTTGGAGSTGAMNPSAGAAVDAGADAGGMGPVVLDDTAPSCAGLSKTACRGESCCARLSVPACDGCAFPPDSTSHLSAFSLEKYEVTVARFRAFVKAYEGAPHAGAGAHPHVPNSGWLDDWNGNMPTSSEELVNSMLFRPCKSLSVRTWTTEPGANEQKPANCLTWYEAFAFCAWEGGFLPTEVEWHFAAAAGTENRMYSWVGGNLDIEHALYGACGKGISENCDLASISEVGSKPAGAGKWGHLDLVGSVWEWILDSPSGTYPAQQPCNDCASLGVSNYRTIRGGSWPEDASYMPVARRNEDPSDSVWYNIGIRCAHAP
jgi:formylglycine-generating enzyme